ncbi:cell envelope biogenesis protein TolA [Sphingomonas oligophenolica]|uniref:Cell envelope biogenesis protein TolA n=1 Tax=Sphingomonas oligophenolica TaxID=301154 RepID=A0A502CS46_9SPHN|nr:cell envelope biogenesis protein TolA [Sphingomonas oligophenolica]TPG15494.1 cell envelope biogenesis protein TolA [Sphingomonas oligophenolica]
MDRAEKVGLGIAVVGHIVLFGLLSVGLLSTPNPEKLQQHPIEVSLVKDVGLEATAPQAVTPPAQSVAPDQGAPEDAAPPAGAVTEPQPAPAPVPPTPAAKPAPAKPAPTTKPAPAPKPAPVRAKPKPAPPAPEKAAPKAAPAKPAASAKPTPATPSKAKGSGSKAEATTSKPRGSRLGPNFLEGLTDKPSTSKSTAPVAAKIDARALASIQQAIARQIQPCADRQVNPGPGANEIVTVLNLRLNEDGTLAATPRMVRQTGVNGDNDRYRQRVVDLGVAAFKGCSPLKLPAEYYSTPAGGWNNINYNWQLR